MRHAVLGAGGVGGLVGGALARAGREVQLILRPETLAAWPGRLRVESALLGEFEVEVASAARLEPPVDVLWVTTKATQLEAALPAAPPERLGQALVVPFLNGIDHVELLRRRYGRERVLAGAIRVEAERTGPGTIRQPSPFLFAELAGQGAGPVAEELKAAGIQCRVLQSEAQVLWSKLVLLAPMALVTAAMLEPAGAVRADPAGAERFRRCAEEACAVAGREGALVDLEAVETMFRAVPEDFRTSMQKDVAAGRPPELDAIAGPILRSGRKHGVPVPATEELVRLVEARIATRAADPPAGRPA